MSAANGPAAGWYPAPDGSGTQRWWDGEKWTEHEQASASSQVPEDLAPPVFAPTFSAPKGSGGRMVEFGSPGAAGKVRSFGVGFLLTLITAGIYGFFWYYFVNDELKDIGQAKGDANLAQSNPAMSVLAIFFGCLMIPSFLSVYNYGQRIQRAQRLGGISPEQQINPVLSFLLFFPGSILLIPYIFHFWYVTKHQNAAVRAAGGLPAWG